MIRGFALESIAGLQMESGSLTRIILVGLWPIIGLMMKSNLSRIVVKRLDGIFKIVMMHTVIIAAPEMISSPSGKLAKYIKTSKKGIHYYEEIE